MVYPTAGFIGMPNAGICFRCHNFRAKQVCKMCHLCRTCCAEDPCVPCGCEQCRWCEEREACENKTCKACKDCEDCKDREDCKCKKHDHECCRVGMFQFCYVKGRYPKKLATYEKMASFIYRESRQEVEIDAAGAANVTKQLRNNADVNETDVLNEWTGLMYASSKGRTKTVQALLSASPDWVDVNATGNTLRRSTALMLAAEGKNI